MNGSITQQVRELISYHRRNWELARTNYAALDRVQSRKLMVNGYEVELQFNPERIRSSAAKIDKASLAARPCFLCEANRPGNQQWIDFGDEYPDHRESLSHLSETSDDSHPGTSGAVYPGTLCRYAGTGGGARRIYSLL